MHFTKEQIERKVKNILTDQLGVDAEEVTPEATLCDDLGADSLDVVEVVMALESEFGIEIPDEDADRLIYDSPHGGKVQQIVDYCVKRTERKKKA